MGAFVAPAGYFFAGQFRCLWRKTPSPQRCGRPEEVNDHLDAVFEQVEAHIANEPGNAKEFASDNFLPIAVSEFAEERRTFEAANEGKSIRPNLDVDSFRNGRAFNLLVSFGAEILVQRAQ